MRRPRFFILQLERRENKNKIKIYTLRWCSFNEEIKEHETTKLIENIFSF